MIKMYKKLMCVGALCLISTVASANESKLGFVNFKECVEKSKQGQFEKKWL